VNDAGYVEHQNIGIEYRWAEGQYDQLPSMAADLVRRQVAVICEVAAILLSNHISAAPVVSEKGELVGIVSEGDLMRRAEIGTTKRHSWWLELISTEWASANEYIKSHSGKVANVMTRDVITAKPDTPLGDVARLLERN
jgi:CBS domain-containing protein